MARESLVIVPPPASLEDEELGLQALQEAFDSYRREAELTEQELETDLRMTRDQLEEYVAENLAMKQQLALLTDKCREQEQEIRYLQDQLESIVSERMSQKSDEESARLLIQMKHRIEVYLPRPVLQIMVERLSIK